MKHVYKDFQELYAALRGKIVEIKPKEYKLPEPIKEKVEEAKEAAPKPKKKAAKKKEEE